MIYALGRFATRFLLLMELMLSWFSLGWVWGGLFGSGVFGRVVEESGMGQTWMIVLAAWAVTLFAVAGAELALGRGWCDVKLRWSVEARAYLGWIGLGLWLVIIIMMLSVPILRSVISLAWASPAMVVGCAVMGWHNAKIALLLNPYVPTKQLRGRLTEEYLKRMSSAN